MVTLFMNVGGNAARIATSLKEGLAPVVIYSFVLTLVLIVTLFGQVLSYWRATAAGVRKVDGQGGKGGKGATQTPKKGSAAAAATTPNSTGGKSAKKGNKKHD